MQASLVITTAKKILRTLGQRRLPAKASAFPDFFNWLNYSVPGMLMPGNVECFEYAIRHLPTDDPILEIGSFCGLSTCHLAHFLRTQNKANALITCDRWIFERADVEEHLLGSEIAHRDFRLFVKDSFLRNAAFFCGEGKPFTFELFSDEFFLEWEQDSELADVFGRSFKLGGPISFAYIDGNHSYQSARRDLENVLRNLVPGGFVLMDDSFAWNNNGAARVAKEALARSDLRLIARNPNYFFQKIADKP